MAVLFSGVIGRGWSAGCSALPDKSSGNSRVEAPSFACFRSSPKRSRQLPSFATSWFIASALMNSRRETASSGPNKVSVNCRCKGRSRPAKALSENEENILARVSR